MSPASPHPERGDFRKANATTLLLTGAVVIAAMMAWLQGRKLASAADTLVTAQRQYEGISRDAEKIQELRVQPQAAASRSRPNEELLAEVEHALAAAGIDRRKWQDSIPQPPVRPPRSDYRVHATRLFLEGITLRQLAAFAHALTADATLDASALYLTNRTPALPEYDVDLAVSYRVYAPQQAFSGSESHSSAGR